MKRNNFSQLMSAVCSGLGCFPVWYWFCQWQLLPKSTAYIFLGGNFVLLFLAWVHRRYTVKLEQKSLLLAGILARIVMILFGVGCYYLFHSFMRMSGAVTGAFFMGLAYLIFWQILKLPEHALLSVYTLILVCVSYLISMIFCFLQGSPPLDRSCFVMLAFTAVLFCFLRNRLMLCEIASAGKKLPKGFYWHNFKILILFLLPPAVLFVFGKSISDGVGWLLKTVGMWLFQLFRSIVLLIFGETLFSDMLSMQNYAPQISDNPILTAVISLVIIGSVLYLLIRFRREILDTIGMVLSHLWDSVRRLISAKAPLVKESIQEEYTDSVELIQNDVAEIHFPPKVVSWKRKYRRFRKLKPSPEHYRMGYALWLDALKNWKAEFSENDTPAQILEKSGGIPEPQLTKTITQIYYAVRYGNHVPTQNEWDSLCQLLEMVRKYLS